MMKKFLIFIFTIFGLFAGMLALIVIDYEINYNKWINSRSGSQLTNPVQKYSSSSDGNKDDFGSSKQEYATSSSSTQNYDYKKYSSSSDGNKDNLESLMNMFMKGLFPPTLLYPEYTRAYEEAKSWSKKHLSQQQIKIYLTKYGSRYSEDATQYALNKLNFDWKENAVKEAESSSNGGNISKERLLEILVEYRKFTQEEAEYAIEHAKIDWLN